MRHAPGIFAFASAPYGYAVSLLRVSGDGAIAVCKAATGLSDKEIRPRHAYYADFSIDSEVVDDVLVTFFKGPHSYTGEDMVEIGFHGSPAISSEVTRYLLATGVRMAEPGEFSRRAFLNGKLDLAQAEGVAALVDAQTLTQARAARELSTGRFSEYVNVLREELVVCLARLEAAMDFPDEDDTKYLQLDATRPVLVSVQKKIQDLIAQYQTGKQSLLGIKVAILGLPNAGKSSLTNALLGEDRALVSSIPGTTRDYIEVPLKIKGEMFWLLDTAGIRETSDAIESAGVELSWRCAEKADLILFLTDVDSDQTESQKLLAKLRREFGDRKQIWSIGSKCDVNLRNSDHQGFHSFVSVNHAEGLDGLRKGLEEYAASVFDRTGSASKIVFTARHLHHLQIVEQALSRLLASGDGLPAEEILSFEIRDAASELASIVGFIDNEDILDKIFSSFCLGK